MWTWLLLCWRGTVPRPGEDPCFPGRKWVSGGRQPLETENWERISTLWEGGGWIGSKQPRREDKVLQGVKGQGQLGFWVQRLGKKWSTSDTHKTRLILINMGGGQGKLNWAVKFHSVSFTQLLLFIRILNCLLGMQTDISMVMFIVKSKIVRFWGCLL